MLAARDGAAVTRALRRFAVVVIRGLHLVPMEQVALTRLLGEPEPVTDWRNQHPGSADILVVSNSGDRPVVGNQVWHSDRSFLPQPTHYTMLRADLVPSHGGDTLFADMAAAFEQAPAGWADVLADAIGVHTYDTIAQLRARVHGKPVEHDYAERFPPVRHPVVRRDPVTGRRGFFLNELCLKRLERPDSQPYTGPSVAELHAHATRSQFVYRHRWQRGDVVIWDNTRVLHRADRLERGTARVLHRTTTAAERAPAAT
ncbi:TauD/TfdA dioxygenase family protein [Kitasatospora sp. NPDC059747]|uniref:TauD/TfdA dioxygenase family protein n=1 Tax=Kitasatospora sp. NPDC059747 TaxID=3346930 RepID=UPI0036471122